MAGKIMELAIAIKGKLDNSFTGSAKQAAGVVGDLNQKLANLNKTSSKSEAWIKQAKTVRELSVQMRQAQSNVQSAAQAMKASGSSSGTAARAYETAQNQVTRLNVALTQHRGKLHQISAGLRQAGFDTSNFAESQKRLQNELTKTEVRIGKNKNFSSAKTKRDEASERLSHANNNFNAGLGYAQTLAAPLVEATQAAIVFESNMADVRKVVDFDTPEQFKQMGADILKLSQVLPMSAEGIAQIVAAGGQSGIARDELLSFAESAAKMGIAFDITADQAGDMMAKWRTAFKMNQSDVIELADKVNYLGNTTAATAPQISDVVTRIGPLGEIGGVASGEIAALGASMVGTGVQSEIAATGIKNLILGMTSGAGATKSQAAAFASLGMDAEEMASKMQTDAKGAILEVMEALQVLPKEQQATVLTDLFGKESVGAIAPLLSNLDALKENFNKVSDATKYAGSMEAEYQARAATTENSIQLLKNTFNALAINIGSALLPAINSLVTAIAPIAAKFADWASKNPKLVSTLVTVAAALGGILVGLLAFSVTVAMFQFIAASIAVFKAAVTSASIATRLLAASQAVLNFVMSMNPIAIVIMLIAAFVAAIIYLWNTNEGFREAVMNTWEAISGAVASAVAFVGSMVSACAGFLMQLPATCAAAGAQFVTAAGAWASEAYTAVMNWISQIPSAISSSISSAWDGIKAQFSAGIDVNVNAKHNARGGIYGQGAFLTTFAEESPEAAIPIDGSQRALDLWAQTGSMLGVKPASGGATFTFAPQITVQGGQDAASNVAAVLDQKMREFESMMRRYQSNQRRLSYE